jgi:hypothetical protein
MEDHSMQTKTPETMSQPLDRPTMTDDGGGGSTKSVVDNTTYNLLMALTSKLEAIEVYSKYAGDGDRDLWQRMADDDRRDADELLAKLKQRLAGA